MAIEQTCATRFMIGTALTLRFYLNKQSVETYVQSCTKLIAAFCGRKIESFSKMTCAKSVSVREATIITHCNDPDMQLDEHFKRSLSKSFYFAVFPFEKSRFVFHCFWFLEILKFFLQQRNTR